MNLLGITRQGFRNSPLRNPAWPGAVRHSPLSIQNKLSYEVWGPNAKGEIVKKQAAYNLENIMVTYGLDRAAKLLSTSASAGSTFANAMAIGTDNTAAASTQASLLASTQSHGTFSRSDQGSMTARYLATFDSTGATMAVHEVGIFQTNTFNGSMICRSVLGTASINRGASDVIQVSYDIVAKTAA